MIRGTLLLAETGRINSVLQVNEGEALGLLQFMHRIKEMGLQNVIFEMGKLVVDEILHPKDDVSEFGAIIEDSKQLFLIVS